MRKLYERLECLEASNVLAVLSAEVQGFPGEFDIIQHPCSTNEPLEHRPMCASFIHMFYLIDD
jgi:hypothetical protein